MPEELHIVPVIFVRQGERLIDGIEFDEACQHRSIRLDCRSHCLHLSYDLAHVLGDLQDAHIETCMLLFVLIQERLKVLVHCVQESVDLLKTGLG